MSSGEDIDASQLSAGAGVPHGELLVRFTDATDGPVDALAAVRDEMIETMGWEATVDAAAVVANFHMMTRIADGTGTPLDDGSVDMSADMRAAIGVNEFESMRLNPQPGDATAWA
ncbi:MAG: hypothetical protein AAF567_20055 [Actinomycetota bacterium]